MKRLLFTILPLLILQQAFTQDLVTECACIWQGFSQSWGYNHRINRLGDFIDMREAEKEQCAAEWVHTAASGSGADSAHFRQYSSTVQASGVTFTPGMESLEFIAEEKEFLGLGAEVTHFQGDIGMEGVEATVLLNGFDLYTAEGVKSDKIHELEIGIDSSWINPATHELNFRIGGKIKFACSSAECEWFKSVVHYKLDLHYLVVVGKGFRQDEDQVVRSYAWTRKQAPENGSFEHVMPPPFPGFETTVTGIRNIQFVLSDEFHMVGWQSYVHVPPQDESDPILEVGLHFGQWNEGVYDAFRRRYTGKLKPPAKWVVKREQGDALLTMDLVRLGFAEASVKHHSLEGVVAWNTRHGNQGSATDSMAVHRARLYRP